MSDATLSLSDASQTFEVRRSLFVAALDSARWTDAKVHAFTGPGAGVPEDGRFYLTSDLASGYAVRADGYLTCVFSLVKGRGRRLVSDALLDGATHGDCFGEYLRDLYVAGGFVAVGNADWDDEQAPDAAAVATLFAVCGPRPAVHFFETADFRS